MNKKRFFITLVVLVILVAGRASAQPKELKFSSTDLAGGKVTSDIFSKVDVTVVNVWGTFCGPCIREMPELAEWADSMPKNVQLIGIVCDVNSEKDAEGLEMARYICDKTGVKFTNVIANESFAALMSSTQFVPTTFLVDKKGKIVGEMIVGANVKKYKKAVESYLAKK